MKLPDHIEHSLALYAAEHVPLGGFLIACVENDLMQAVARADDENQYRLADIARYIYNKMPMACHGSPAKAKLWLMNSEPEE